MVIRHFRKEDMLRNVTHRYRLIQSFLRLAGTGITAALIASAAQASSSVSQVGSARVEEGKATIQMRSGYTWDGSGSSHHNRLRTRQHFDYGFTDWYALRVITRQNRFVGGTISHEAIAIENRFQILEAVEDGWDAGIRLTYKHNSHDDTPNHLEVNVLNQVPVTEEWEFRSNIIGEYDIEASSGDVFLFELRSQMTRKIDLPYAEVKSLRIGVEMFNDFGALAKASQFHNQGHIAGTVIKLGLENGISTQASYRYGISRSAPDHTIAFSLGYSF